MGAHTHTGTTSLRPHAHAHAHAYEQTHTLSQLPRTHTLMHTHLLQQLDAHAPRQRLLQPRGHRPPCAGLGTRVAVCSTEGPGGPIRQGARLVECGRGPRFARVVGAAGILPHVGGVPCVARAIRAFLQCGEGVPLRLCEGGGKGEGGGGDEDRRRRAIDKTGGVNVRVCVCVPRRGRGA